MAITKTNFINYTRCPRFFSLAKIHKDKLDADITYKDYIKEQLEEEKREILSSIYEDSDYEIDITKKVNPQMEAMMPYYKKVEIEAGKIAEKYFKGDFIYAEKTQDQKRFECIINNHKYVCYLDLYNGQDVIEIKATTSKKYWDLLVDKEPIFEKSGNILHLRTDLDPIKMEKKINKLLDRYSDVGHYMFDIAVQRYFIEHSNENKEYHYYLGLLNNNYIYDGNGEYHNIDGEELITFIDVNEITQKYQDIVDKYRINLERYIDLKDAKNVPLTTSCERKKTTQCIYFDSVCGKCIPKTNSIFNYLDCHSFKDDLGDTRKCIDLVNDGYLDMLDIPEDWIKSEKHFIQRDCYQNNKIYIDKEKIKAGLDSLKYPIYHLDFETFPCPIPRFKGEKPYMQSPFEFSLHVEREPGVCDFEKDSYVFLAKTFEDEREELVKQLIKHMPGDGTMFAQNYSFERGRIIELSKIFPQYRKDLLKIIDNSADLLWFVKTNKELYMNLGFDEARATLPNYYCKELSGSYSIKKTLPVFSDLSYSDLIVKNGTEAVVTYARYNEMSKEEFNKNYEALVTYCHQDTWAMVVILDALRNIVK